MPKRLSDGQTKYLAKFYDDWAAASVLDLFHSTPDTRSAEQRRRRDLITQFDYVFWPESLTFATKDIPLTARQVLSGDYSALDKIHPSRTKEIEAALKPFQGGDHRAQVHSGQPANGTEAGDVL